MNRQITETETNETTTNERKMNDINWVIDRYYHTVEDDCETAEEVLGRIINILVEVA